MRLSCNGARADVGFPPDRVFGCIVTWGCVPRCARDERSGNLDFGMLPCAARASSVAYGWIAGKGGLREFSWVGALDVVDGDQGLLPP